MFNKDNRLIFENYKQRLVSEAPIYGGEDFKLRSDPRQGPGGGYALKDLSDEQIQNLVDSVKTLFDKVNNKVDGAEYTHYYSGDIHAFRNNLTTLVQRELGIGKTQAGYTARIIANNLNVLIKDEGKHLGRPAIAQAVEQGIETAKEEVPVSSTEEPESEEQSEKFTWEKESAPRIHKDDDLYGVGLRVFEELPSPIRAKDETELLDIIRQEIAKSLDGRKLGKTDAEDLANMSAEHYAKGADEGDFKEDDEPETLERNDDARSPEDIANDVAEQEFGFKRDRIPQY